MVEKASNGNVEYIIAESKPIKTAIILIYNPPSNFSLPKFKEAIAKVNKYLASNKRKEEPYEVILAGDLNFPSTIVTWEDSDVGVCPNPVGGEMDRKKGFEILNETCATHYMSQMVNA